MKKKMPVEEYLKLTNSDKLEIERLLFEIVRLSQLITGLTFAVHVTAFDSDEIIKIADR